MLEKTIVGTVVQGTGRAGKYIQMPQYKQRFYEKLDFVPYSGTLNLKIENLKKLDFSKLEAIIVEGFYREEEWFDSVKCYKIIIEHELSGVLIIPERLIYKELALGIVEIIAPINLKEYFNLKNGDGVEFEFL